MYAKSMYLLLLHLVPNQPSLQPLVQYPVSWSHDPLPEQRPHVKAQSIPKVPGSHSKRKKKYVKMPIVFYP